MLRKVDDTESNNNFYDSQLSSIATPRRATKNDWKTSAESTRHLNIQNYTFLNDCKGSAEEGESWMRRESGLSRNTRTLKIEECLTGNSTRCALGSDRTGQNNGER